MPDTPSILKDPVLKHDEDYNYLREKGRQYIEELGSALWTDYNEHDPGITILEALCYAITELGYRTSFPIKDLLTEDDGTISSSQTFFTAKKILTQSPLNKDDYRKLLIDIEGVQNAWLFTHSHYKDENGKTAPAGEVAIYADPANDVLTSTASATTYPVYLRGLYKVLLDLDEDPQLGDLNNSEINIQVGTTSLIIVFKTWKEMVANFPELFNTKTNDPFAFPAITFPPAFEISDSIIKIVISFPFESTTYTVCGEITVGLEPASGTISNTEIQDLFTGSPNLTQQLLNLYLSKIRKANSIVQLAVRKLNRHRNLCEDFVSIETVKDEEIAFCFDVDIIPSADMEEVEAYILFTIEEYLNPDVKFYLLNEMRRKTNPATGDVYTVDEIFEGPRLKHGFIDTTELENTELVKEIYSSEIISRIMNIQIDGENVVLAVRNFMMSSYDDKGQILKANQRWCIKVSQWRKPVLAKDKSKITIYKNGIPFIAEQKETDQTLQWLQSSQAREKLTSTADDIPILTGTYFPLETYTSIQQLFPQTYAIGNAALPSTATNERRAQARQLKAYLLFYDQLLADFFMQLKNAKALFSTDAIKQTYFAQFVDGFKDADSIYTKGVTKTQIEENVLGTDPHNATIVQDSQIVPPQPENGWEKLYEPNETFVDRRNRFLDHLMARFAESFNEYVFMMYSLDNTTRITTRIDPADLINSKREFLSDYPHFSYNRAKAFDYCPLDKNFNIILSKLWNTDNVSGLEEKLCLLGGFKDCTPLASIITTIDSPAKFQYCLRNAYGDILTSVTKYDTSNEASKAFKPFSLLLTDVSHFNVKDDGSGNWFLVVTNNDLKEIAVSNLFVKQTDAVKAEKLFMDATIIKRYERKFLKCIGSGENILLTITPLKVATGIQYSFNLEMNPLIFSSPSYENLSALFTDLIQLFIKDGILKSNFTFASDGTVSIKLNGGGILQGKLLTNITTVDSAIDEFINELKSDCCNESLYLIEHILLRPRDNTYNLAPVCLDEDCKSCSEDDPYSFRISIVLPYWVSHFDNKNFRTYFEKLAREEVPAHCMVKVCWINQDAMLQFEICYFTWIQAMALYYSNKSDSNSAFLKEANNNLINALYSLHSEYPVATLHDCNESKDTNPVLLGKTVLGTFNNQVYDNDTQEQ